MKSNDTIKYFPFAPKIPWRLRAGKYVIPELAAPLWRECLQNKEITVVCFGGLIEAYFSFSILQGINYISPNIQMKWAGPTNLQGLCDAYGLAKYTSFDPSILERFPTPIFFDRGSGAYFNCLNNYIDVKSYYGGHGYRDKRVISQQIVEKSLITWNDSFLPKFSLPISKELDDWIKMVRLRLTTPLTLVIPEKTSYSIHKVNCLDWNAAQVKALGVMLKYKNMNTIVFSDQPKKYYDPCLNVLPLKLEYFWYFLPYAGTVLSADIDFLFLANCLSQAKLFTNYSKDHLSLNKNNKFLNLNNKIYKKHILMPSYVFEKIMDNL